ncbi:hypothetical protein D9757_005343 [Collybiopsis confluens]|uniref:Uncharacterized protein n=1 Tax=Collybiopsis confluens TaxID=2823264 RepID=A0A8H5HLB6_9AGAR|nr:hypothetical protein D9757_005343 [Collybiopsis confluens]
MGPFKLAEAVFGGILASAFFITVQAFSFTYSPTGVDTCGNISIKWTGGSAPFYLLAVPVFGTPRNFSIPDSAFSNGQGSYSAQINIQQAHEYVLIMSDSAGGFASGGISPVLKTTSITSGSCNITDPGPGFLFELNDNLAQCRSFTFDNYPKAIQPVEIMGIIPGGQPFTISPPKGPTSYTWDAADIWNGTTVMFMMVDFQQKQGGASGTFTVGVTDDMSCISTLSPSATASQFALSNSSSSTSGSSSLGAILGSVLGGVLILATVIAVILFYLRRRKERRDPNSWIEAYGAFPRQSRRGRSDAIDLLGNTRDPLNPSPFLSGTQQDDQSSNSRGTYRDTDVPPLSSQYLPAGIEVTPFTGTLDESPTTRRSAKGSRSSRDSRGLTQTRYIVHHDAEDLPEEVVELPPQYSERRGLSSGSSTGLSGAASDHDRKNPHPT